MINKISIYAFLISFVLLAVISISGMWDGYFVNSTVYIWTLIGICIASIAGMIVSQIWD